MTKLHEQQRLAKVLLACVLQALFYSSVIAAPTESSVLSVLTHECALPSLAQLANSSELLKAKVQILCKEPNKETLQLARSAWQEAYIAWLKAEPFLFGPGNKLNRKIGKWEVNGVVLEAAIDSPDLADFLRKPEQRGYAAVEYLLFTPNDAVSATEGGRSKHLLDVTDEIAQLTSLVNQAWLDEYAEQFDAAGDGSPFLTPADALSIAYIQILNITEKTLRDRIGIPSGFFEGEINAETLEAWRSQNTLAGLQAALEGIKLVLKGGGNDSIIELVATKDGLVEKKNPELAKAIEKQLAQISQTITDLDARPLNIEARLQKNPTILKKLYRQLQTLQDQLVEASLVLELDSHGGIQQVLPVASN